MDNSMSTLCFQIEGTHCQGCQARIESKLGALPGVRKISVNYVSGETIAEFDAQKISKEAIYSAVEKLGYHVAKDVAATVEPSSSRSWLGNLLVAGALLALFAIGYLLIQQLGLLQLLARLNETNLSYGLISVIGLLASFHCVGMCGGLVVTYTVGYQAACPEQKAGFVPHLQYNLGRVLSYSAIGAILGGIGGFFGISPTFTGIITLLAGAFMVLMGLSLLGRFKGLERFLPRLPDFVGRTLYGQTGGRRGPFIIGLLNGFMPCGPLQAMQLYALGSGGVTQGALAMAAYALGTVPLLFGLGNVIALVSRERVTQVMRLAGVVVILLGLLMLNRGLVNFGYGFSGLLPGQPEAQVAANPEPTGEYQTVTMALTYQGYGPNVLQVKKDVPVRWVIDVKQMTRCTDEIILPEYNIRKKLAYGENIIEFTPKRAGEIKFSCWMRMVWGSFQVIE
jgi:sulfite exporter TauE/SafE/copper chaperone CopZ